MPDEHGDAEHDAGAWSGRAQQVLADVRPGDEAEQDHRRTSSTMRPSRSVIGARRSSRATCRSWVTMSDRRAEALVQVAGSARGSPRRCACRGCRSARRPAGSAGRWTARARWRRAGARRRTARRAGARGAGRAAPGPAVRARGRRPSCAASRAGAAAGRRSRGSESVGSRLKNWKMKPILSRRTRVRSSSDEAVEALRRRCAISPGGRAVEAADEVEQRGLAGAGRPDDRDHLAARDGQV